MAAKKRKSAGQSDEGVSAASSSIRGLHIIELTRIRSQQHENLPEAAAEVDAKKAKASEAVAAMRRLDINGVEEAITPVSSVEEQRRVSDKRRELLEATGQMLSFADDVVSHQDEAQELVSSVGENTLKELEAYENLHIKLATSAREARQEAEKAIQAKKAQMELAIQDFGFQRSEVASLAQTAQATVHKIHAKEATEAAARQQLVQEDLDKSQALHRRFLEVHEPQGSLRFQQNQASLQDLQQSLRQCQLPPQSEELVALAARVCDRLSQPFMHAQEPPRKKNKWWPWA